MNTVHSYLHFNLNAQRAHTLLVSLLPLLSLTSLAMPESFSKYSQCVGFCHCPRAAHMAPSYSKHAHSFPQQMMCSVNWRMLIADGFLPATARWRMFIATLHFWARHTAKVLCPHSRQASVRWQGSASRHRRKLFWKGMEQHPACESAVAPLWSTRNVIRNRPLL